MTISSERRLDLGYEPFAEQYDAGAQVSPFNTRLERPTLLSLLPDNIAGADILDVGCAGGNLSTELVARGARVTAFDSSPTLVNIARSRLGSAADVRVHDLYDPLSFVPGSSIDIVLASLVLHYLEDWVPALLEFARVLRPDGRLVLSTGHPMADMRLSAGDYHERELVSDEWSTDFGTPPLNVSFFRRPLAAIFDDLAQSGFVVRRLIEPRPGELDRAAFGHKFERVAKSAWFLCLEAYSAV